MTGEALAGKTAHATIRALLAAIIVSGVTTFMFYPLITLELLDRGQSAVGVGIVLGLLSGVGPIASTIIGRANASWGSRRLAVGGLLLRSAGLCLFAVDAPIATYAVGAVIASIGSNATALAIKTELMRTSTSRRTITLRSIAINIGALIGPSIGGILFIGTGFSTVVVMVVAAYAAVAALLLTITFHSPEAAPSVAVQAMTRPDTSFLLLCTCVFGYWAIYALWPLAVPLIAVRGFGTTMASTWAYTGNAVLILMLQYGIVVRGLSSTRSSQILGLGFAAFVGCFATLAVRPGPGAVVLFVTMFSLAEMLVSPTLDEITGRLRADGFGLTRAYGLTGTISGVASLAGAAAGGVLIERSGGPAGVLWLGVPLALTGMVTALALGHREPSL